MITASIPGRLGQDLKTIRRSMPHYPSETTLRGTQHG
jgi:hypothetical protein